MTVIGIHCLESMFGGAGKMQRVRGPKENRSRIIEENLFHFPQDLRIQGKPDNSSTRGVLLHLRKDISRLLEIDHAATLPIGTQSFPPNPQGGPVMHAGGNINDPVADQWMYHAVANAILAHSFLLSLPGVDASRTGITGISWGGVLCDIVPSIDRRFRFAVSVYGTGNISNDHQDGTCFVRPAGPLAERELWRKLWDRSKT